MIKKLGAWGIGPMVSGATGPAWARPFQFAADFRNVFVRLGGRRVSMQTIDGLYHSRASARRAEDSAGVSREFANGAKALTDRGYDSTEGWTNLSEDPLMTGADPITGALPTNWTTISSAASISCVGRGVEDGIPYVDIRISGVPTNNVQLRITRGNVITAASGDVFTAEAASRMIGGSTANVSHFDVRSCEAQAGTFLVSSDSAPFDFAAPRLGLANRFVTRTFNNASTNRAEARLRLQVTANQPVDITLRIGAPQFTRGGYHMPFGVGTIAPDSLVIPAADAGLAVNPSATGLTIVWRGRAFTSAATFASLVEVGTPAGQFMLQYRKDQNFRFDLVSGGTTVTRAMAGALDQERTFLASWRPDGTCRCIGVGEQFTVTRAPINEIANNLGVGRRANSAGSTNAQTLVAGIGAFALSDTDALALFNQVAAA